MRGAAEPLHAGVYPDDVRHRERQKPGNDERPPRPSRRPHPSRAATGRANRTARSTGCPRACPRGPGRQPERRVALQQGSATRSCTRPNTRARASVSASPASVCEVAPAPSPVTRYTPATARPTPSHCPLPPRPPARPAQRVQHEYGDRHAAEDQRAVGDRRAGQTTDERELVAAVPEETERNPGAGQSGTLRGPARRAVAKRSAARCTPWPSAAC